MLKCDPFTGEILQEFKWRLSLSVSLSFSASRSLTDCILYVLCVCSFYADFGPLNLAMLYRYCCKLNKKLKVSFYCCLTLCRNAQNAKGQMQDDTISQQVHSVAVSEPAVRLCHLMSTSPSDFKPLFFVCTLPQWLHSSCHLSWRPADWTIWIHSPCSFSKRPYKHWSVLRVHPTPGSTSSADSGNTRSDLIWHKGSRFSGPEPASFQTERKHAFTCALQPQTFPGLTRQTCKQKPNGPHF